MLPGWFDSSHPHSLNEIGKVKERQMNQLQAVEVAQNRLISQLDAATAALDNLGRDPLNQAVERFEAAANRVKERFADAQIRVLKLAQALIGDLAEMADGIAFDFTLTIEEVPAPQPVPVLPPVEVAEVTVEQEQQNQGEEQPEPPPAPVPDLVGSDGSSVVSRLTEEQKNLVADLAAAPPGNNGRYGKNKRKR